MIDIKIGIIGYGNLGKALFSFFKENNIEVYYNDIITDNSVSFKNIDWLRKNCKYLYITVNTDTINNDYYDFTSIDKILLDLGNYDGNVIISSTTSLNTMDYFDKKYKLNIFYNPFMFVGGDELNSIKYAKNIIIGSTVDSNVLQNFYKNFWPNADYHIHSLLGAEFLKLLYNHYIELKVNFAIKTSLQCDIFNIDANEILSSLKRFSIFNEPSYLNVGLPVGGPCIPRDSKLLHNLFYENFGIINNDTSILFNLIAKKIIEIRKELNLKHISILGKSYKFGVNNDTNSPSITLGDILIGFGESVMYDEFDREYLHIDIFNKFVDNTKYHIFSIKKMKLNENKTE